MTWDETSIGIFLNTISAIVLLITVIIMAYQTNEMRRATFAGAFKAVLDTLQEDSIRAARRTVFRELADKPFSEWTEEEQMIAERVIHSYDNVGAMIRHKMIPVRMVADNWGSSLRDSWQILSPMVEAYRVNRNASELYNDFEWLAKEAEKYHVPVDQARKNT